MGPEITFIVVVVVVVIVAAIVAGVMLARRRRPAPTAAEPTPPPRPPRPEPPPMRGLEDALNQATDRSGTTMAARLDAEADHVEQFRHTDDTGPLLRRALDSVHPDDSQGDGQGPDGPTNPDGATEHDDAADDPGER